MTFFSNTIQQKCWVGTSKIWFERDSGFQFAHFSSHLCSNETSYHAVSCTMQKSMWWETKGSFWPIAKKELRISVLQLMRNKILPPDMDELERLSLSLDVRWNPTKVTNSSQFSQDFSSMSNEVSYPRKPLSLEQPHRVGHPRSSPRRHLECSLLKDPEPDDQAKSHPG